MANFNVVVRIAGFLSCKENDIWANENAKFWQNKFYYITKGSCIIRINGRDYHGKKGDWFFIPANTKHSYYNLSDEPFEKYWFHFDLYPSSDIFNFLNLGFCINTQVPLVLSLFEELFRKYNGEKITDKLDVKYLAIRLLSLYITLSHKETVVASTDTAKRLSHVLAYINDNLDKHISNATLSELCYQHPNHFVRFFKEKIGTTPQKYIMERRVEMAKRLIEQTDLSFSDIAAQVGLCDGPHLTRVFKKYYALNPQDYRKIRHHY